MGRRSNTHLGCIYLASTVSEQASGDKCCLERSLGLETRARHCSARGLRPDQVDFFQFNPNFKCQTFDCTTWLLSPSALSLFEWVRRGARGVYATPADIDLCGALTL